MKVRILTAVAALALGTAISGGAAHAATYLLTVDGCGTGSAGCIPSTDTEIGKITVTEAAHGTGTMLDFTVALDNGAVFNAKGNDQHHAFVFNLAPGVNSLAGLDFSNFTTVNALNKVVSTSDFAPPTVTKGGVTTLDPGPFDEPPLGKGVWSNAVDYVGTAAQGHTPSNFSFELTDNLDNLKLSMLTFASTYGGEKIEFGSDVYSNKNTGNVGALYQDVSAVPEPAAWGLMIVGVFCIGAAMRQQRRRALVAA